MKSLKSFLLAILASLTISFSALGDDIEIYYGISDKAQTVNPNVIFIFDTSGSMSAVDGTSSSRMFKSKEALKIALNTISGVNVSLMRFSNRGGPILIPAVGIDDDWNDKEVVRSLFGDYDFAVSESNGTLNTQFSRDYLVDRYHNRSHLMRFTGFDIPKGATIESAHITYFSEDDSTTSDVTFTYFGLLQDNPIEFSDGESLNDRLKFLDGSSAKTGETCADVGAICWKPSNWLNEDYPMNTPNLAGAVQAIVDDGNWAVGDPIVLAAAADRTGYQSSYWSSTDGTFEVFSHAATRNSRQQKSPQLRVRYSLPADGSVVDTYTARDKLVSLVEEFVAEGSTPVVDTLFEAYQYLNGKAVINGGARGDANKLKSLSRLSHSDSYTGTTVSTPADCDTEQLTSYECRERKLVDVASATYVSPVDPLLGQCQANYIVLFSDGAPNNTYQSSAISSAIGKSCSGEQCANDLAEYMATKPSERADASSKDAQAFTYTVGFESAGFDDQYLKDLASAGKGTFYSGDTAAELANAFISILVEAKKGASTFVAPGISVNQFNRLTHSNDIYYALFDPKSTEYWPGNLKKYKLIDSVVEDNAGVNAISSDGFFRDDAHDHWANSSSLDGSFVSRGGASDHQSVARRLYSNLTNSTTPISEDDSRITTALLGIDDLADKDSVRKTLIQWMRGYDMQDLDGDTVTSEPRNQMADPLHSEPLFYNYGDNGASVYIGTNEGYLMSIDANSGKENWAFMPQDLMKNVQVYFNNPSVFNNRTYGMDGAINAWKDDGKSYLIVGQRRGGNRYFVLDITSKNSPIFKYEISADSSSDFANLGQSWSKPTVTSIDINGQETKVLVFGGGYDTNQDSADIRTKDTVGNSVFIVEASTGKKLAEISGQGGDLTVSGMDYSIPARVAVIDKDFDGLMDHMYVTDMGGQVFRIDVYNGQAINKLLVGSKLYSSSVDDSEVLNRRFYSAPDVAEIVHDNEHYYAVTVGSGYRAHPLNEVNQDSVILLKDKGVFAKDDNGLYTFPAISTLGQITPNVSSVDDLSSYDGYEFNLAVGEKVLTGVSIINSRLVFSTYDPSSAGLVENSCSAAQGGGRLYVLNLLDGQALRDLNNDGTIDYNDTFAELDKSGIPAEPRLIITDPSAPTICIGTECADTIISADDEGDRFKELASEISGAASNLNKVFSNSWSSEVEPAKKD